MGMDDCNDPTETALREIAAEIARRVLSTMVQADIVPADLKLYRVKGIVAQRPGTLSLMIGAIATSLRCHRGIDAAVAEAITCRDNDRRDKCQDEATGDLLDALREAGR